MRFALAWHFPNLRLPRNLSGRQYAGSLSVRCAMWPQPRHGTSSHWPSRHGCGEIPGTTRRCPTGFSTGRWPPAATLATSTCHWLANGRFYGWEGVGCCEGTCTHVWHYAHAVARLFPQLERSAREMADFGVAFDAETGLIGFRGEAHRMRPSTGKPVAFCGLSRAPDVGRRYVPAAQLAADPQALKFLMAADANGDGIIEGQQHNTLDADWYGPVAWLSGLYLAALAAGERMARKSAKRRSRHRSVRFSRPGASESSRRSGTASTSSIGPTRSIPTPSTPGRAATLIRCSVKAGRTRSGSERVFEEHTLGGVAGVVEVQLHARRRTVSRRR